jgi:2-dehydro-3-deoxyphosphooctonate aldolase (KDO 8-P synthase)
VPHLALPPEYERRLFMRCHPEPDKALSDGPNASPLDGVEPLVVRLLRLSACD